MVNLIKKYKNASVSTKIIIGLLIIEVVLVILNCNNVTLWDYTAGVFTEIVGIIITLLFVDKLIDSSKEKQSKEEEREQIKRFNIILECFLERYKELFYCVTTPIEEQAKNKIKITNMPEHFKISDMKDMFIHPLNVNYGITESSIVAFFNIEKNIREYIIQGLQTIDFRYYSNVKDILMEFINISINYDSKNAILEADKLIMGKKKAIEVIPKLIEENGEEFLKNLLSGNIKSGNLLHPYAYLYIMLNKERDVVKKYEKAINEI